jgi:membrane-associated phospholipid phosphatase
VSGHSTFSAAGARVLRTFFGSDSFGASVTIRAGTSRIEPRTATQPGSPAKDVTLYWPTLAAAAAEAGQSRRYGGIHFPSGDLHGRSLGDAVGGDAWTKAQSYIRPLNPGPI